jgi:hypothetical protein
MNRRCFAVLIDWRPAKPDYIELLDDPPFTLAEAEAVARECRRLGGQASVHTVSAARKLAANFRAAILKRKQRLGRILFGGQP